MRNQIIACLVLLISLAACASQEKLPSPTSSLTHTSALTRVPVEELQVSEVALSPDGRTLVATVNISAQLCPTARQVQPNLTGCNINHLFIIDSITGEKQQLTHSDLGYAGFLSPFWSPDGLKIGFSFKGTIWLTNVDGTEQRPFVKGVSAGWSPDGHRIAVADDSLKSPGEPPTITLKIYDLATGQSDTVFETSGYLKQDQLAWSPNGRYVAFVWRKTADALDNELYVTEISSGIITSVLQLESAVGPPSWTADSQWVIYPSRQIIFAQRNSQCQITPLDEVGNFATATMSWRGDMMVLEEQESIYLLELDKFFGPDYLERLSCP